MEQVILIFTSQSDKGKLYAKALIELFENKGEEDDFPHTFKLIDLIEEEQFLSESDAITHLDSFPVKQCKYAIFVLTNDISEACCGSLKCVYRSIKTRYKNNVKIFVIAHQPKFVPSEMTNEETNRYFYRDENEFISKPSAKMIAKLIMARPASDVLSAIMEDTVLWDSKTINTTLESHFKIGVSFCGEHRYSVIEPIVINLLTREGFTVNDIFYDNMHLHLFNGIGQADKVAKKIYSSMCDFVVVFLSEEYDTKKWTWGIEFPAIRQIVYEKTRESDVCLLSIGDVDIRKIFDGDYTTNVSTNIDGKTPSEVVDFILLCMNKRTKKSPTVNTLQ